MKVRVTLIADGLLWQSYRHVDIECQPFSPLTYQHDRS
jgi:hypothetical protein